MTVHEGGCLCGGVRYAATGQAVRVTHCYCRFCQQATGSTHMFEPVWPADRFSLTRGVPRTYVTRSEGSGKKVSVHFCEECGTKLYLSFERFPDAIGIYGGTLDEAAAAIEGADQASIFLDEAPKGCVIPAGMKAWPRHKITNDGEPIAPTVSEQPRVI